MNYEQQLDFILQKLLPFSKSDLKPLNELLSLMDSKMDSQHLEIMLRKLIADGNVDHQIGYGYRINANGIILTTPGNGYHDKKVKEEKLYKNSISSKRWSMWNTIFVILTLIATIIIGCLSIKC